MAKSKTPEAVTEAVPAVWKPDTTPDTLALGLHGRALELSVAGNRRMQISLDSVELGINEINLNLPGIRLRIGL
jgi:hypothetical protein